MSSRLRVRRLAAFLIAIGAFLAQIYGISFAFIISALLLIWQVYEHDLPKSIFKYDQSEASSSLETRRNLRILTAVVCGMTTIGASLLQLGFSMGLSLIASGNKQSSIDTHICIALIGGLIWLVPEGLCSWYLDDKLARSFRKTNREGSIKRYSKAHFVFFTFATFLGFGGDFFVTSIILGIGILYFLDSLGKRGNILLKIYNMAERQEKIEKSIWATWLRKDRTVVSHWLFLSLNASVLLLVINFGLTDFTDLRQIIFLVLIGVCSLYAYVGVREKWRKWKYCVFSISLANFAFLFAYFDPFAMPINKLLRDYANGQILLARAEIIDMDMLRIVERLLLDSANSAAREVVMSIWIGFCLILIIELLSVYSEKAEQKRNRKVLRRLFRLNEGFFMFLTLDLFLLFIPNLAWGLGREVSRTAVVLEATIISLCLVLAMELYLRKKFSLSRWRN